ncbi:serine hydrolase domain-containing protein, partial [Steroidobacter sp.]|uniref:serine hydrolase domain-containing protein n=1 Tax=Steroidobacter sp. TaxID=1978227 RepID=UPI001A5A32B9
DPFDDVREHIRAGLIEGSVPSIAVAVAKDGKVIWEEGFGWADRERRIPASEHTMYSLASISKPITATGLMTLVQARKVRLDAPANDYLGNAKLRARVGSALDGTVRRLADHTSGLPLHYQFFYADESAVVPSMDETILRYGNLVTAPGEKFNYSNLGYGVLDHIMARVSGLTYAEFMRREVFIPLGLTRTSVGVGAGLEQYTATRYSTEGQPLPFYDFDHPGASAVFSSAHDLVRFGLLHLKTLQRDQRAILTDAAIDEMQRLPAGGNGDGYGLGFFIDDRSGVRVVSHNGGMPGVATTLRLFPESKLAIAVLSNSDSRLPRSTAERIAQILLPQIKPIAGKWPEPKPFTAPPDLLGVWRGVLETYAKNVPLELRFMKDGDVHASVGGEHVLLVNDATFTDGQFAGVIEARLGTPDADRLGTRVSFSLKLRGDVLNGGATVQRDANSRRERGALTHWVELRRLPELVGR